MRRVPTVMAIGLLATAGCGDGGEKARSVTVPAKRVAAERPSDPATRAAAAARASDPPGATAARTVALRYLGALSARDWTAACATRSPSERRYYKAKLGSCEQALSSIFAGKEEQLKLFGRANAGTVRRRGDRVGIDILVAGASEPVTTLAARRVGGAWYLEDTSDAETP
jgi:hypothetical protein